MPDPTMPEPSSPESHRSLRSLAGHSTTQEREERGESGEYVRSFETLIPMPGSRGHAFIRVPQPLTDTDWSYLMDVLTAMRPGLVIPQDQLEGMFAWLAMTAHSGGDAA